MRVNPETNEFETSQEDVRSAEEIAQAVLAAEFDGSHMLADDGTPLPQLTSEFVQAIGQRPTTEGIRDNWLANSPVKSSRFL